jgi:hypothetical protein
VRVKPIHLALLGIIWTTVGAGLLYGFGTPMLVIGIMLIGWAWAWAVIE